MDLNYKEMKDIPVGQTLVGQTPYIHNQTTKLSEDQIETIGFDPGTREMVIAYTARLNQNQAQLKYIKKEFWDEIKLPDGQDEVVIKTYGKININCKDGDRAIELK